MALSALSFVMTDLHCRRTGRDVTVRFLSRDGWPPVELLSGSAFDEPTALACGTPCLQEAATCVAWSDGRC